MLECLNGRMPGRLRQLGGLEWKNEKNEYI